MPFLPPLHRSAVPITGADGRLVAFTGGVLLVSLLPLLPADPRWTWLPCLFLLAWRRRPAGLLAAALGVAWAALYGQALLAQRLPPACDGHFSGLTGIIAGLPQRRLLPDGTWQQRVPLEVDAIDDPACRGPERVSLAWYGEQALAPGERWHFIARLRLPWGEANPGGFNRQDFHARAGLHANASVRAGDGERLAPAGLGAPFHRARAGLAAALGEAVGESPAQGLLTALLVGDKSQLTSEHWSLLRAFGVVHLVVISGLHVSLVAGLGLLLGGLCARFAALAGLGAAWTWLRPTGALLAAAVYAGLAGFTLPTQRALAMLSCVCLALCLGRSARSGRNLLLAAALVLAANPLAAVGSSFWLSFLAVAWLLWFATRYRGLSRWRTAVLVHGFMAVAMAPLTAWWFGGTSLVSAPANLILVPLVGAVLVPLLLLGALASPWLPVVAEGCWQFAAALVEPLLAGAAAVAARAGMKIYLETGGGAVECLFALLGVLFLFGARRPVLRAVGALGLLPLLWPASGTRVALPELTVLDVGQGTAVVFRSGGRTLVYDTGGGDPAGANAARRVILPYLRQAGVRRITTLVVSHPDRDHSAGVGAVLEALPVGELLLGQPLPGIARGRLCRAGASWRWPDGTVFRLLSAAPGERLGRNDASCVLRITANGRRFLLTGDIGRRRERGLVRYWRDALRADWLLVAHHGSASSTGAAFLRAVTPRWAAFTFGRANPFGHPAPAVVQRLCRGGSRLDGTAAGGALRYQVDADGTVTVSRYRDRSARYWRRAPPLTPLGCHAYNRSNSRVEE
ncbi:MAG: DNA internalization-related competence protein ComEC/Rec2 [Pseudohaliea sp.]